LQEQFRNDQLIQSVDALNARVCSAQRELLRSLAEANRREVWRDSGAGNMAHWVSMRYGVSYWKASRWIESSHALERLPLISQAFVLGELSLDKVVELTRFATVETEDELIGWANTVSTGRIRREADLAARTSIDEARDADRDRTLKWWYFEEGRRFALEAELPAADGAVVARALDRLAEQTPVSQGDELDSPVDARRADALVTLASTHIAQDVDPDRATVIVHAQLPSLVSEESACELDGGAVIHSETARRLLCTSRVQVVLEDGSGEPLRLGRTSREPTAAMMRQLRYRDRECRFPACGARRFTQAHHIVWWERGGRTDIDNLVLVCTFHHKLVHEYGWSIRRERDGTVQWFHPDGARYRAGPGPPDEMAERQPGLSAVGA
jgi:Domain of unknown function (DUF222)/HNH endonuclease